MTFANIIKPLTEAFAGEQSAAAKLESARRKREEAERTQAEWEQRTAEFERLKSSLKLAEENPLAFAAANDNQEFSAREIMLMRNVLQMQSTRRDLRGQVLMSLSLHRQDGTSDPVFGDLTRVRAVLGEIEESPEFIALMARVKAHASNRAKAHGDTLRQTAAALIKFGTSNGVHPDDIDALKVHVG